MLIDQPIPNLFGGVSQQPALSRYPNQLNEQVNCVADPIIGLAKRPPTEHIKKLIGSLYEKRPAVIIIKRDEERRYAAFISNGTVRVFDLETGTEKTVTNPSHLYLDTEGSPADSIRALTVADYTFLLNREKTVEKDTGALAPALAKQALVFVRAANYGKTYQLEIKTPAGVLVAAASYTVPNGSSPDHAALATTDNIASQLKQDLALGLPTSYTLSGSGSLILVSSTDNFTITSEDGQGKQALRVYKDKVQRFTDLPEAAYEGFTVQITGDQSSAFDDYWVRYNGLTWEETIAPGSHLRLDASTLPRALVRNPDDTFSIITLPVVNRTCGDDDSNPFPSFVDQKIRGMFLFKNRLGFLADENAVMSKSGDYFNFFRTTVTTLLADDPIDVSVEDASGDGSEVSLLENAVAFDETLILFARQAQYALQSNDGPLTPGSAEAVPVTNYQTSSACRPVAAGKFVFFAFDREGAAGIREMNSETVTRRKDAPEVTAHVPTYLPGNLRQLSASTLENILVAVPASGSKLYNYDFLWSQDNAEKLQSAWGRWEFHANDDILAYHFVDNVGYLFVARADGYHLERMRFRPDLKDDALDYFTQLDRRVTLAPRTYDAITDRTTFTVPWPVTANMQIVTLHSAADLHAPGDQVPIVAAAGYSVAVAGNKTAWSVVIGVPYTQYFDLTRPVYTPPSSSGTVANTEATLKVKKFSLDFAGTGYFVATFAPKFRGTYSKTFSGNILGATPTDIPTLDEGSFRIGTPCDTRYWNLSVANDSPFPARFLSAAWSGVVSSRSRRV